MSNKAFIETVRRNGVVGAGGAGFPAYVKLGSAVDTVIVNAAECEPLMHKDKEILRAFAGEVLEGLRLVMRETGAGEGVFGVKEKYTAIIAALQSLVEGGERKRDARQIRVHPLHDFYPAGDEFVLTYEVTRRVVPPGGIPPNVGVLTQNVETLLHVARGTPVTHKYLTVAGAVARPATVCVPIGVSFAEAIALAGGPTCGEYDVLVGGAMMGRLARDTPGVVTRTTGGLIVLPDEHPLLARYRRDVRAINRIGRAACDQCVFCTQLCPRYLLGHPIEPHRAMRALGLVYDSAPEVAGTIYCCECNLCSMMACPEDLDPKNVCVQAKAVVRERGVNWKGSPTREPHPLFDGRRTPIRRLKNKLGLREFRDEGPLLDETLRPERVVIPLRQHVGVAARPVVQPGDTVRAGQIVGDVAPDQLGCPVHASIEGRVAEVRPDAVVIEKS